MERRAEAELDAGHLEEVAPHVAREDGIAVTYDGRREAVKPNDAVEEGAGDRRRRVWVTEGDEVGVLREAINHCEDDRLPMDLRKAFNKVHGDVCPHLRGNLKGLEQPRRSLGRREIGRASCRERVSNCV